MKTIPFRKKQELHLKIFRHHQLLKSDEEEYYQLAYDNWKQVWKDVQEIEMNSPITHFYSDDFTRQDHIISLFDKNECIGVAFMREINPNLHCMKEDSSFRYWPESVLDNLSSTHKKLIMATFFTITPQFRRTEIEWKTLFLSLYLDYFSILDAGLMITAARKLKSNEKLCYQLGGEVIEENVAFTTKSGQVMERELTDILCWKNKDLFLSNRDLQELRQKIWQSYLKENPHVQLINAWPQSA